MNLIKNSFWNALGFAIPIVVAIPAMGYLARSLGIERFGIFTICYAIVGYASILDLGLSRAVIRAVAIDAHSKVRIESIMGTATTFVFLISLPASAAIYFSAEWLTALLAISKGLRAEATIALQWLSFAIPPLMLSSVWFSYLEGSQDFFKLNKLKILSGLLISLTPLLTVAYYGTLVSAITGIVIARLISMIIAYRYSLPGVNKSTLYIFNAEELRNLIVFGGWVTVSNIISPIMVYFDRLFLSSLTGAKTVAFYSAPAEAVSKLLLIPSSIIRVLFPKLSAQQKNAENEVKLTFHLLAGTAVGVAGVVGYFAEDIMFLWLGKDYLGVPVTVLKILLIGFVFNSIAQLPYAKIQASGSAKTTAIIHAVEILPYLALLYYMIINFSLIGAACAWSTRTIIDYIVLELASRKADKTKHRKNEQYTCENKTTP